MQYLIWGGAAVTLISVAMLGWCVVLALRVRRAGLEEAGLEQAATRAALQKVLIWNMAAIGLAAMGLMAVVTGVILV